MHDLDGSGSISLFMWWHKGVCSGVKATQAAHRVFRGVQVKPLVGFYAMMSDEGT